MTPNRIGVSLTTLKLNTSLKSRPDYFSVKHYISKLATRNIFPSSYFYIKTKTFYILKGGVQIWTN